MTITSMVTSKGQLTLPSALRKAWKIGSEGRRVRFELSEDGSVRLHPVPDALSLQGVSADSSRPYDPQESEKAIARLAREAAGSRAD